MTITEREDSNAPPSAEVHHDSLVSKARKGTAWTVITYAAAQIIRLGSTMILARIFAPSDFGLMTILYTMMIGLTLFSDVGLAPSVIRSEEGDDPHFLNTVWTVQVFRGLGLWLISLILAWPAAQNYNPQLLWLAPVIGLSLIISGFNSTSILTLNRHMEVRKVTTLELFAQIVQLAVTVLAAYVNRSVWALVIGKLAADTAKLIASFYLIPNYRNWFAYDKKVIGELLSFGKWILASTALTFLSGQSDKLVLGKLVSTTTLGLYGMAFTLADIPRQVIMAFRGYVGLPFVSGFSSLPRQEFRAVVLRYRRLVLLAGGAMLAIGVNFADLFLIRIYPPRFHAAAWIVPILALGLWHTILYSTAAPCLTMLGKQSYNVVGCVLTALVLLVGVPIGFGFYGFIAAIWIISFSDLPVYFCNLYGLWRENLFTLRQDLEMSAIFIASTVALYFLRSFVGLPWTHPVPMH